MIFDRCATCSICGSLDDPTTSIAQEEEPSNSAVVRFSPQEQQTNVGA